MIIIVDEIFHAHADVADLSNLTSRSNICTLVINIFDSFVTIGARHVTEKSNYNNFTTLTLSTL